MMKNFPVRLFSTVLMLRLSTTAPIVNALAPSSPFTSRRSFFSDLAPANNHNAQPADPLGPSCNTSPAAFPVGTATQCRRQVLRTTTATWTGAFCGWILEPRLRHALHPPRALAAYVASNATTTASADSVRVFVQGTVTLPANYQPPVPPRSPDDAVPFTQPMTPPALYITCRPKTIDNIPQAILDGSRGKAPPVLTARYENPTFPFVFQLTSKDVTLEGLAGNDNDNKDTFWWEFSDVIVSARLDTDGVAATRGPDDLVGRTSFVKATDAAVELELMGRGAFGKFATSK